MRIDDELEVAGLGHRIAFVRVILLGEKRVRLGDGFRREGVQLVRRERFKVGGDAALLGLLAGFFAAAALCFVSSARFVRSS